jgi:hypothetical protein
MLNVLPEPPAGIEPRLCFVLMPFQARLAAAYSQVRQALKDQCGITCRRADEIQNPGRITADIWHGIHRARFLVADLTERNPNVFYELGAAHALRKRVILLIERGEEVPFDLVDVRYLRYDIEHFADIVPDLVRFAEGCIATTELCGPRTFRPPAWSGAYVKIAELEAPSHVEPDAPFEIYLSVWNNGPDAVQGYFSLSFPEGVSDLEVVEASTQSKIGTRGEMWSAGRIRLRYPIAEASMAPWPAGLAAFIRVRGRSARPGLLWYYVNACCEDAATKQWRWDPDVPLLDKDQRDEHTYCGVIRCGG